jgi:predicted RNase H-like HicB family nuclease
LKFDVTLCQDESGTFVVECPVIPGCISQGKTREEALINIREAIEGCLIVRKEEGLPLTVDEDLVVFDDMRERERVLI